MIAPIDEKGGIDIASTEKIINRFAACGVSPLLMGTTGEGNSFAPEQALTLVQAAVEAAQKRITIYAGVNGCCVSEHIRMGNEFAHIGADVIVATLPSYYALTDEQMYTYYMTLADGLNKPLMLYNITSTTHQSIPLAIVERLARHGNIVGIKDSERDARRMEDFIHFTRENRNFTYFCGWAAQSAHSLELGADGIVPSTANYAPEMFADLYWAVCKGDMTTANRLQQETDALARIYQAGRTLGQSLAALKVMMGTENLCQPYMLPPLTRLGAKEEEEIRAQILKTSCSPD
jgi:4-hydroxy-tetrahydrodipicolinate synthase